MSGDTLCEVVRRPVVKMRVHDYLYDSAFIVSGARDYARTAFKAAMASAQVIIQPVYETMFSELKQFPRMQVVYHPNCRLPAHVDRSYAAYQLKLQASCMPVPEPAGRDLFKYTAVPKKVLPIKSASPDFQPPTPLTSPKPRKPVSRGTQSIFRESSAQTVPWQPEGRPAEKCEKTPEVLYLDKMQWGPGSPYRTGDLPADFHTTEMINKMRHARKWSELMEKGQFPRWMKTQNAIITDIETKDWIFREAEIDELQEIRLSILHKLQEDQRQEQTSRTSKKLAKVWARKKSDMERKIGNIRKTRDRELRKLAAQYGGDTRVEAVREARGGGRVTRAAFDRGSSTHAPLARFGVQARHRHATLTYDLSLLEHEDHEKLADIPPWLEQCTHLKKTCSGRHLPKDTSKPCERETKWSEQFLENLHNDLKKARLGAAKMAAEPLHILKPRQVATTPRPTTPEVEGVSDEEEMSHQAALILQKIIRGRAVQNLMFEGKTRAAELTEELKTTHGLQREDRARIAKEEMRARDHRISQTDTEQKEEAISALVEELCGGAVSAALDFLEKELRRLKEERRQHAYILIALREKSMREAAEAGRRQKEEHRRREHDEIFKQVVGVTHETVDAYLQEVIREGVELAAEEEAVRKALSDADQIEQTLEKHGSMSTAEQNEVVAELVHQFLLPEAHKAASRLHLSNLQAARAETARRQIFGVLDEAEIKEDMCARCGSALESCRCRPCDVMQPTATSARDDPRWKHSRRIDVQKSIDEWYPPAQDIRCMLNALVNDAVSLSHHHRADVEWMTNEYQRLLRENTEITLDARERVDELIAIATGELIPVKRPEYHHYMRRFYGDALDRSEPLETHDKCPKELPSEIRQKENERSALDTTCRCDDSLTNKGSAARDVLTEDEKRQLLPSELRYLEEMKRCKCDIGPSPSPVEIVIASDQTEATEEYLEHFTEEDFSEA